MRKSRGAQALERRQRRREEERVREAQAIEEDHEIGKRLEETLRQRFGDDEKFEETEKNECKFRID